MIGSTRGGEANRAADPVSVEPGPAMASNDGSAGQEQTKGEAAELLPTSQLALAQIEGRQETAVAVATKLTALPPPTTGRATVSKDAATYAAFAAYASELAARDPLKDKLRESALLAEPGLLVARRAPCRFLGNAVMIDLDPSQGLFDPDQLASKPALASALSQLRDQDVAIFWSSGLTADRAGDVKNWLRTTGLDPVGKDQILLLRYSDDRKQTRREEAAKERCLIAMLGDERSDFDELFDYLKNPDAAIGLDAMLGKGWFLAPVQSRPDPNEGQSE
ncbi:HAD family hydrolase [Parerythrobacter jejuensis]|uniref:Uncharacterized protein n=1 Tax=Parerythrobacter jejuensis TaxID=795812 RepID=A0A845AM62_9SPHN|nr:hypothetical protein [Parerythrobacter jejuensis]MXP30704.1 hypothetical protein [Parerythrobacter jejuensis]MXP33464.1 hypothetical protein [Parerythrobacter jejuensis]